MPDSHPFTNYNVFCSFNISCHTLISFEPSWLLLGSGIRSGFCVMRAIYQSICLQSQLSQEVNFPWKSTFLLGHLSSKVNFPWKSTFPFKEVKLSWEVKVVEHEKSIMFYQTWTGASGLHHLWIVFYLRAIAMQVNVWYLVSCMSFSSRCLIEAREVWQCGQFRLPLKAA